MNNSRIRIQVYTGIVIRKRNFGESDKMIELLTRESGKIRILAKGARKSGSKMGGSTELFSHGTFTLAKGKNFYILTGVEAKNYSSIWKNLLKLSRFYMVAEFIAQILPEEQSNNEIYENTLEVLSAIDKNEKKFLELEYIYKTIYELGFVGTGTICGICHTEDKNRLDHFDIDTPGIICRECSKKRFNVFEISKDFLKMITFIESHGVSDYTRLSFDESDGILLGNVVDIYLEHIHQKEFKSQEFIGKIKSLK